MKDNSLLKRLKGLGFSLFETGKTEDVNLTLADVVKSKDLRLWEGFPVVLATSAENGHFDYTETAGHLKRESDKLILSSLTAMSLALYKALNLKFLWSDTFARSLNAECRKSRQRIYQHSYAARRPGINNPERSHYAPAPWNGHCRSAVFF